MCWAWGISPLAAGGKFRGSGPALHTKCLSSSSRHCFLTLQLQYLQQRFSLLVCWMNWGSLDRSSPCYEYGFTCKTSLRSGPWEQLLHRLLRVLQLTAPRTHPIAFLTLTTICLAWRTDQQSACHKINLFKAGPVALLKTAQSLFLETVWRCRGKHSIAAQNAGWIPNNGNSDMRQKQTFKGL